MGSICAQSVAKKKNIKVALACGMAGGLAPDLDVLIRSAEDPLLSFQYHRHFTHSLVFVPFGGLIVALFAKLVMFRKHNFKDLYIFSTIGFATHGLLDSCTTYGTHLFWPFSDRREAWNTIAIIDPVFTITLVVFSWISSWHLSKKMARIGLGLAMLYMSFGVYQNNKAADVLVQIAHERGHSPERYMVMPTFANLVLWRSIYEHDGHFYTDSIRTSPFDLAYYHVGDKIRKLDVARDFPTISEKQKYDIERFSFFAGEYVALIPGSNNQIGDYRYTFPNRPKPMWGIKVKLDKPNEHVDRVSFRNDAGKKQLEEFWMLLSGENKGKK